MSKKTKSYPTKIEITDAAEARVDRYLAELLPDFSRTYFKKLINARAILIDQHPITPHHLLKNGQVLTISWPSKRPQISAKKFGKLPFPILFEDEELLVINKPAGILCHPAGARGRGESVVDLLAFKLAEGGWPDDLRPGLVHRLDKDTTGVLIFAKNPDSHSAIAKQFLDRKVKKTYVALVQGTIEANEGTLEGNIARNPFKRNQFYIAAEGRWSVTQFEVVKRFKDVATQVVLHPLTGRTHQLRVQLTSFGHPIIGDTLYGGPSKGTAFARRQMLHAAKIEFMHPEKKKKLVIEAPLPADFQEAIKVLRSRA